MWRMADSQFDDWAQLEQENLVQSYTIIIIVKILHWWLKTANRKASI